MTTRSLLIFVLNDARFCVDAARVRETVWLPELTLAEEAPPHIVGIFALRDRIVPVIDLNLRFGHPAQPYRISDQIVVLELGELLVGMIVGEVIEVIEISAETIQPPPKFDVGAPAHAHLVEGEVRVGDDLVTLLDARQLVHQSHPHPNFPPKVGDPLSGKLDVGIHFCPQATPEEHATYRARARMLMETVAQDDGEHLALAVVELGGEYFGIGLEAVQEFCDISRPSHIPCCPPYVLGAVSLRGNLLTLLDLRAALNLSRAAQNSAKAVVALLGDHPVGVAVDEVHDVVYLRREEMQDAPPALREQNGAWIRGAAPYGGKAMAILDLPALLAREEWVVDESV